MDASLVSHGEPAACSEIDAYGRVFAGASKSKDVTCHGSAIHKAVSKSMLFILILSIIS